MVSPRVWILGFSGSTHKTLARWKTLYCNLGIKENNILLYPMTTFQVFQARKFPPLCSKIVSQQEPGFVHVHVCSGSCFYLPMLEKEARQKGIIIKSLTFDSSLLKPCPNYLAQRFCKGKFQQLVIQNITGTYMNYHLGNINQWRETYFNELRDILQRIPNLVYYYNDDDWLNKPFCDALIDKVSSTRVVYLPNVPHMKGIKYEYEVYEKQLKIFLEDVHPQLFRIGATKL